MEVAENVPAAAVEVDELVAEVEATAWTADVEVDEG
jgi:hypothetical protein